MALANPRTRERLEGVVRERKALARLVELATAASESPLAPEAAGSGAESEKIGGAAAASADTEPQSETPTPTPEAAVANAQEQP